MTKLCCKPKKEKPGEEPKEALMLDGALPLEVSARIAAEAHEANYFGLDEPDATLRRLLIAATHGHLTFPSEQKTRVKERLAAIWVFSLFLRSSSS